MACKVLHDSQLTLSHQGRVPGHNAGKLAEHGYSGWRTLEDFSFSLVHVVIVYQSTCESMSSRMQSKPFLRTSALQFDSLRPRKCQR